MILTKAQLIAHAALLGMTCATVGTTVGVTQAPKIKKAVHRLVHKRVHRKVHKPRPAPTPECPPIAPIVLSSAPLPVTASPVTALFAAPPVVVAPVNPDLPPRTTWNPPIVGGGPIIVTTPGTVPEPAAWAMMITGFALIGFRARKKACQTTAH